MSVAEIKTELAKLTPAERTEVETALQALKTAATRPPVNPAQFLGSLSGVMHFGPDWNESLLFEESADHNECSLRQSCQRPGIRSVS